MDPMNLASPEGVTAVAATWLGVRLALPYLRAIPRVGGFLTGQRVWALVLASAFGIATLEGLAPLDGPPFDAIVTLREAIAITVAAIGTDRIVRSDGPSAP